MIGALDGKGGIDAQAQASTHSSRLPRDERYDEVYCVNLDTPFITQAREARGTWVASIPPVASQAYAELDEAGVVYRILTRMQYWRLSPLLCSLIYALPLLISLLLMQTQYGIYKLQLHGTN